MKDKYVKNGFEPKDICKVNFTITGWTNGFTVVEEKLFRDKK